jgi:outer membrane protein
MKKTTILLLSVATMLSASAQQQWSYQDCVDYARDHNISLQQSRLAGESSQYSLEAARAQWAPSLNFSTSQGYVNTPFAKDGVNKNAYSSNYGLNAGWTVWDGGSRENNIKRSELQTNIAELTTNDLFRTLETDILSLYINILYAKEAITINEDAVVVSKEQMDRAESLMNSGRLSKVDYQQFVAQYEQDRYAVVNAQGTYDTQRMQLKKLLELGISQSMELQACEWTAEQVLAQAAPIEESYQLALITDAQLQAKKLEIESAELDQKIAKSSKYPQIALNAGVGTGYNAPGSAFGDQMKWGWNENIGLSVSVPILDNKKTKVAVAQARIDKLNAELDQAARENELAQTVEGWYVDLQTAQARYISGAEQVKSVELSDTYVNEQFKVGKVNTVELLQAHSNLLSARRELLQAKYMAMLSQKMIEYYRTASVTMP